MLLRRRRCCCSGPGPLLLLLGAALCVFYQTLMSASNRLRSGPPPADVRGRKSPHDVTEKTRRVIYILESLQRNTEVRGASQKPSGRRRAVVLTGRHQASDTEVQLYQQVLQQLHYDVHTSRYTETSSVLQTNQGVSGWSLLLCLSSSERSCLRRVSFSHLQRHQRVNLIPALMDAFSDAGAGLCHMFTWSHLKGVDLPLRPYSCGSTNQKLGMPQDSLSPVGAPPPGLVAMVNIYVLVTSVRPLTSFLHDVMVVATNQELRARPLKLRDFLRQKLGPASSHHAFGQMKHVIGEVLQVAVSTNERTERVNRCVLCYQLLTFTLMFSGSNTPVVVQVDTDLTFSALRDDTFDGQVTKDLILEDTLHFLSHTHLSSETDRRQYGVCGGSDDLCLSEDEFLLLLQFQRQMSAPSAFQLLFPSSSSSSSSSSSRPLSISDHMIRISCYYNLLRNISSRSDDASSNQESDVSSLGGAAGKGRCGNPHLRQIYTDPPLTLTPPFSPGVKEYCAEVTFDTVMVRIRPMTVSSSCAVHLDEHRGPRMANYPVGLGNSRISILVTDDAETEPVVMTIYTVHLFRENRPSLPMFTDHVMCSFVQDCGLRVRPDRSCGLQTAVTSQRPRHICTSGHQPGRWVVPCLSCSDNRTCDWREVAWQPDGCYHRLVERRLLQGCMTDRKVLFIGDSTNRGMMYFLMERVNSSLEDWGKAHDTLVHRDLNAGQTLVSYSYYPQFWLEKEQRPTFREALLQLLHRSQPLVNSNLTVLVVGGVQWLNTNHLWTVSEVLDREGLSNTLVVVKTLGMGFHLPVDGIRSLSLREIQDLDRDNDNIMATAKHHGYEVIDTFSITMGRYKEFLQGRCACHFHEVERFPSFRPPGDTTSNRTTSSRTRLSSQSAVQDTEQEAEPDTFTYHVRGPVNQVYSEILLSRLCPAN
ncbi:cadherin-like and PC-esterase domain-containing protein 1 [Hippoglossus hippoglossus]|uniref:cadherin-like and PC-esterase domain-containing protein 1 n=1 Tax=Hippoglossus hippoglossus TaxID=8267 RepID=UPI00148C8B0F|nr:cadherin-like and PC-esterase domain-containing protein 1 [Hippoglossus hippoglossus]XP_034434183.1 cadherin-like and PC-esterase domain-containing protein 1 [Hippoglossus hippoglossus]